MNNNTITIDDLAIMVKNGFDKMDEKFDKIDERFEGIENEMQRGFSSIHAELDKINNELTYIKAKLDQAIKTETEDTGAISGNYLDLAKRVKIVEEQVEQLKLQKQIA